MRIYDYMKGILGSMGVGEDVGVPEPSWRIEEYLKAIYDKLKEGGGSLQGKKFIVTLTPTSLDYSGMMDKTVAEINAAYEAGQEIVFRVMMSATTYMDVDCTARWFSGAMYPSFNGFILDDTYDSLILAGTGTTNDGTKQTYSTKVYPSPPQAERR